MNRWWKNRKITEWYVWNESQKDFKTHSLPLIKVSINIIRALRIREEDSGQEENFGACPGHVSRYLNSPGPVYIMGQGKATHFVFCRENTKLVFSACWNVSKAACRPGILYPTEHQEPSLPISVLSACGSWHLSPSQIYWFNKPIKGWTWTPKDTTIRRENSRLVTT